MLRLFLLDFVLIAGIVCGAILCRRKLTSDRARRVALSLAAIATVLCHYSSLPYHQITEGMAMGFLGSNPNLLLPIYPCNVVMWCCVILAFVRTDTPVFRFLTDYIFLFGTISALVGMFVNVDFFRNPTLLDYDVTKGILAHALLLFNVALLPAFGYAKPDLPRCMRNLLISIVGMGLIGLYCNTVFSAIASPETAYNVNSMFLLHSPFDGVDFLVYPVIAAVAVVVYFGVLVLAEFFLYPRGERWYDRLRRKYGKREAAEKRGDD